MAERKNIIKNKQDLIHFMLKSLPFQEFTESDLTPIIDILNTHHYKAGDIVLKEGDDGSDFFLVESGEYNLNKMGRSIKNFTKGDFFGEIAALDGSNRTGTITCNKAGTLYSFNEKDLENEDKIPLSVSAKVFKGLARLIASYIREEAKLYEEMEVLLIQDGGCAPGYNPVTAFISEYLENAGFNIYVAAEGFRSVVSNQTSDYRRLIYNPNTYSSLEHIPGVIFSPPLREARGADFRSERYPEFKEIKNQKKAAENIISRKVKIIIGIGGNGTFAGINALSEYLPNDIQHFFIPVTIDSDIYGSDCIGEFTGVEVGAEKIRCYMADARTHKRIYIIEMMGADGGFHALHSALGAGAHLAVLPSLKVDMKKVIKRLNLHKEAVIVVAEGYKEDDRKTENYQGNAAEFFRDELLKAGLETNHKVVCEGFSRDIRGAMPNNLDLMLAQRMASQLRKLILAGETKAMPAVLSGKDYSIPFAEIKTDNSVESNLAKLSNRLING
jgi:6-phosphofructokinase